MPATAACGGVDNTGMHHALGVLSANATNEELTEGCTLGKQGSKPMYVPVALAESDTPATHRYVVVQIRRVV